MHSILKNPFNRVPFTAKTTEQIIQMISDKGLNPNLDKIQQLRAMPKSGPVYRNLKQSLACFTPNAYFSRYVNRDGITSGSGQVYIDLDAKDGFELESEMAKLKANHHVTAAWRSVSGRGLGCLVRSDWSDAHNFKFAFGVALSCLESFGSSIDFVDRGCKDVTRVTFISYCEDVYYNKEAVSIPKPEGMVSSNFISFDGSGANDPFLGTTARLDKIRHQTELDDWADDETVRFLPEGKEFIEIIVGKKKYSKGIRNSRLFKVGCAIKSLNPELTLEQLSAHLWSINTEMCITPLSPKEVSYIAESVSKTAATKGLRQSSRKKKVWFNPTGTLTPRQKQSIAAQHIANYKSQNTFDTLKQGYRRLIDSGDKPTQKKLAELTKKSIGTVKRYWKVLIDHSVENATESRNHQSS